MPHIRTIPPEEATGELKEHYDAAVQRAGLEVLARYGDPREVLAVVEPLALNPGPNQDLAVRTWLRIREEQAARRRAEQGIDSGDG